ncbi:hypothetical protein IVA83_31430 [Bradyrhizobium sp. 143]|nr:hypothetical protein [Bradyrhizobium sp. 143]MCK1728370.1 hypothetical protein [Bradyrhizobium sp. 142]
MRIARLDLLCDRLHVAKAPFEWIAANIAVAPDMRYAVSTTLADWWMVQVAASRTALNSPVADRSRHIAFAVA